MMLPSIKPKEPLESDRDDTDRFQDGRCGRVYMGKEFGSCGRDRD